MSFAEQPLSAGQQEQPPPSQVNRIELSFDFLTWVTRRIPWLGGRPMATGVVFSIILWGIPACIAGGDGILFLKHGATWPSFYLGDLTLWGMVFLLPFLLLGETRISSVLTEALAFTQEGGFLTIPSPQVGREVAWINKFYQSKFVHAGVLLLSIALNVGAWQGMRDRGLSFWHLVGGKHGVEFRTCSMAACLATIVFHYVLYLWVLRSLLWFRLNRAVTRQEVRLRPLHPDRCGGLSYLGRAALTWTILVVSIGILVALDFAYGVIARNGLKGAFGEWQYWVKIIAYIALAPFVLVGPLLPWRPHLCHEKHRCYRLLLSFGNSHARSLAAALDSAARGPLEQLPAEPMLKALTGVQSLYERLAESVAKMRTIPMDMHTTIRAGWTYVWPMSLSLSAFLANIAQVLSK